MILKDFLEAYKGNFKISIFESNYTFDFENNEEKENIHVVVNNNYSTEGPIVLNTKFDHNLNTILSEKYLNAKVLEFSEIKIYETSGRIMDIAVVIDI